MSSAPFTLLCDLNLVIVICLLVTTGVDQIVAVAMHYSNGRMANLTISVNCLLDKTARIFGTKGAISVSVNQSFCFFGNSLIIFPSMFIFLFFSVDFIAYYF